MSLLTTPHVVAAVSCLLLMANPLVSFFCRLPLLLMVLLSLQSRAEQDSMLMEIEHAHGAIERSTMEVEDQKIRLGLAHDSMRSMELAARGFEEVTTLLTHPLKDINNTNGRMTCLLKYAYLSSLSQEYTSSPYLFSVNQTFSIPQKAPLDISLLSHFH